MFSTRRGSIDPHGEAPTPADPMAGHRKSLAFASQKKAGLAESQVLDLKRGKDKLSAFFVREKKVNQSTRLLVITLMIYAAVVTATAIAFGTSIAVYAARQNTQSASSSIIRTELDLNRRIVDRFSSIYFLSGCSGSFSAFPVNEMLFELRADEQQFETSLCGEFVNNQCTYSIITSIATVSAEAADILRNFRNAKTNMNSLVANALKQTFTAEDVCNRTSYATALPTVNQVGSSYEEELNRATKLVKVSDFLVWLQILPLACILAFMIIMPIFLMLIWRNAKVIKGHFKDSIAMAQKRDEQMRKRLAAVVKVVCETLTEKVFPKIHVLAGIGALLRATPFAPVPRVLLNCLEFASASLQRSSHIALELINAENESLDFRFDLVDLRSCVEQCMEAYAHRALAKGVSVSCTFGQGCPSSILTDERRVRQVLLKFISNAIRNTDSGSVDVFVVVKQVCRYNGPQDSPKTARRVEAGMAEEDIEAGLAAFKSPHTPAAGPQSTPAAGAPGIAAGLESAARKQSRAARAGSVALPPDLALDGASRFNGLTDLYEVQFEVKDTGKGIPKSRLDTMFQTRGLRERCLGRRRASDLHPEIENLQEEIGNAQVLTLGLAPHSRSLLSSILSDFDVPLFHCASVRELVKRFDDSNQGGKHTAICFVGDYCSFSQGNALSIFEVLKKTYPSASDLAQFVFVSSWTPGSEDALHGAAEKRRPSDLEDMVLSMDEGEISKIPPSGVPSVLEGPSSPGSRKGTGKSVPSTPVPLAAAKAKQTGSDANSKQSKKIPKPNVKYIRWQLAFSKESKTQGGQPSAPPKGSAYSSTRKVAGRNSQGDALSPTAPLGTSQVSAPTITFGPNIVHDKDAAAKGGGKRHPSSGGRATRAGSIFTPRSWKGGPKSDGSAQPGSLLTPGGAPPYSLLESPGSVRPLELANGARRSTSSGDFSQYPMVEPLLRFKDPTLSAQFEAVRGQRMPVNLASSVNAVISALNGIGFSSDVRLLTERCNRGATRIRFVPEECWTTDALMDSEAYYSGKPVQRRWFRIMHLDNISTKMAMPEKQFGEEEDVQLRSPPLPRRVNTSLDEAPTVILHQLDPPDPSSSTQQIAVDKGGDKDKDRESRTGRPVLPSAPRGDSVTAEPQPLVESPSNRPPPLSVVERPSALTASQKEQSFVKRGSLKEPRESVFTLPAVSSCRSTEDIGLMVGGRGPGGAENGAAAVQLSLVPVKLRSGTGKLKSIFAQTTETPISSILTWQHDILEKTHAQAARDALNLLGSLCKKALRREDNWGERVGNLTLTVCGNYHARMPYHNFHHGLSVMQAALIFLGAPDVSSRFSDLDRLFISLAVILATDMAKHFKMTSDIQALAKAGPSSSSTPNEGGGGVTAEALQQWIVHAADISNPILPFDLYKQWAERVRMHVNMNYQTNMSGNPTTVDEFPVMALVEHRHGSPDYAILRLGNNAGGKSTGSVWGVTEVTLSAARVDEMLCIIQHPAGRRKEIKAGPLTGITDIQLRYTSIDTMGGTSGAGILNKQGHIVGVYTHGGCTATTGFNVGVCIDAICAHSPALQRLGGPISPELKWSCTISGH
uniref:PDEase domain-containing protein n=1 Tax=Chromera velia CCMP2878 TaxID=1169474 RepID=A0A0G4I8A5_9ALVE|eukprot:Cvel_11889.t1-p1 / transcript=Cvel_11889.t1 / gene=Cvel_11889 / organism=Chromera_velia_CCMP2878 / gene_product=hypothetical protein / transcript_product=hypothetical protein / location=Cvel_scaffold760:19042-36587(-) / protein_length=1578 / sequence_SO=supercontig / SO=protein_coding / is_pseudo=false